MLRKRLTVRRALLFLPFCFVAPLSAAFSADDIQLSGFGTIGLVMSDSDQYGYRVDVGNDDGVFKDDIDLLSASLLGLQLDTFLSESSQLTLQVVLRDQVTTSWDSYLRQAFYKLSPSPSFDVRVGRIPADVYSLTEVREIGFAYPWAMLPAEVYGLYALRYLDGADFSYSFRPGAATLTTKFFIGDSEGDFAVYNSLADIKLENTIGLSLTWSELNWQLKANYTHFKFADTSKGLQELIAGFETFNDALELFTAALPPGYPDDLWVGSETVVDDLVLEGTSGRYLSLSGHYNWDNWTVAAEVSKAEANVAVVPDVLTSYISLAYASGRWTYYGLVSNAKPDTQRFDESGVSPLLTDPNSPLLDSAQVGPLLAAAFQQLQPAYQALSGLHKNGLHYFGADQLGYSIGTRYDFSDSLALNLQFNHTIIEDQGGTLWWVESESLRPGERVNTILCTVSFIF